MSTKAEEREADVDDADDFKLQVQTFKVELAPM